MDLFQYSRGKGSIQIIFFERWLHPELQRELLGTEDLDLEHQHRVWLNSPGWKSAGSISIVRGALKQEYSSIRCQDTAKTDYFELENTNSNVD